VNVAEVFGKVLFIGVTRQYAQPRCQMHGDATVPDILYYSSQSGRWQPRSRYRKVASEGYIGRCWVQVHWACGHIIFAAAQYGDLRKVSSFNFLPAWCGINDSAAEAPEFPLMRMTSALI
jgi:hypothetical protein